MSHPDDRRVVITGLGAVSSIGIGADEFLAGLRAGRGAVRPIRAFDTTGFEHANGCEIADFNPARRIARLDPTQLGPATQLSVAAAAMALDDAGLASTELRGRRGVVAIGTANGESRDLEQLVEQAVTRGADRADPALARRLSAARLGTAIAREFRLTDVEAVTVPTACSAGNYAIGYAFDAMRAGEAAFALCGGVDAMCRNAFAGFYRLGALARQRCQPFDRNRRGFLLGEGAGVLLLESLAAARARGARGYAEVLGYGLNCDATHPVAPDQDSVARCMRLALDNAGVKPAEVDFVSAHGTATQLNDVTEARAIRQVFGERPPRTVSIKSMLGHTLGAASALAAIACALAITHGFIPPTINHVETDPECELDCVPNKAVPADLQVVQNNGFGFGGNNAVLLLGRYER